MSEDITITCTDSRHDEALVLYTFAHETHEGRRWPLGPEGWREAMIASDRPNVVRMRKYTAGVSLDEADRIQMAEDGPMGRERYNFRCESEHLGCGDAVTVRHEKLVPILDRLADAGLTSVSLRDLRAILT